MSQGCRHPRRQALIRIKTFVDCSSEAHRDALNRVMRISALFLAVALLLNACDQANQSTGSMREYQTRGIVRAVSPDRRTLDIQHEEIPGYMPTMTMPFALKEPAVAEQVKVGDGISFRLLVDEKEAFIDRIAVIPAREVSVPPPDEEAVAATTATARLRPGDNLPEFSLTNQDGQTVTRESFRGRPLVLTFVFTRCPIPNFCPLMSRNFAQLQEAFAGADGKLAEARLLSISIDPQFDTPQVLKDYAASQHADHARWSFATGAPADIAELTKAFAVMVQPESGTITHGLATALIDGNGRIVEIWRGNGWKAAEVIEKINELSSRD